MTQDERWLARHDEIMAFMAEDHRRPSKYYMEERITGRTEGQVPVSRALGLRVPRRGQGQGDSILTM